MREMKDSGIAWIGAIPNHWKVSKIKQIVCWKSVKGQPDLPVLSLYRDYGVVPKDSRDDNHNVTSLDTSGYKVVERGDLVINKMKAWQGSLAVSEYNGIVSPAYHICKITSEKICKKYLHYLLRDASYLPEYMRLSTGLRVGQWDLSFDDFKNIPFLVPPLAEQDRIAAFLDAECAEIDAVLEKTRASIEEYKKLKQAVITQAVTKGIRGDRPMKDSGSVWFEEIPCNWVMKRIKYLFHIKKDIAGKEGYTVLSITQRGIQPKDLSKNEGQIAANYSQYQLLAPGDFAMNHMDLLTGWVDISKYSGVTSPDYRVFVLDDAEKNDSSYYLYLMQMCYFNRIFYGLGQGVSGMGRWRLQADKFLNFPVVVPPVDEQKEIASYLNEKCSCIEVMIAKKQQYLTEIENYKKSLIYEYVTGKKEVHPL